MPTSIVLFRQLAPEFSSVSDDDVGDWIELAARRHTASAWGAVFVDAMVEYAAHMMTQADVIGSGAAPSATAGPVTARKAGGLAESYGAAAAAAAAGLGDLTLLETKHGRNYLHLLSTRAAGAPTHVFP